MATLYPPSPENIEFLARKLLDGDLVAIPTETVYGLAANAFNSFACRRIFDVKRRPLTDPLIVHIGHSFDLNRIAYLNKLQGKLAECFWPGPLTLILRKKAPLAPEVSSGLDSVAVRMPSHPLLQQLFSHLDVPLAAPSANPFAYISPTTARHVEESLGRQISYILDGGPCTIGLESTILDIRNPGTPRLLRPGGVSREELADVLKMVISSPVSDASPPIAPRQMKKLYSPKTMMELHEGFHDEVVDRGQEPTAFLYFNKPEVIGNNIFWLTDSASLEEAAHNLFGKLREIDAQGFKKINVELAPESGLGCAINDRLRRAAST